MISHSARLVNAPPPLSSAQKNAPKGLPRHPVVGETGIPHLRQSPTGRKLRLATIPRSVGICFQLLGREDPACVLHSTPEGALRLALLSDLPAYPPAWFLGRARDLQLPGTRKSKGAHPALSPPIIFRVGVTSEPHQSFRRKKLTTSATKPCLGKFPGSRSDRGPPQTAGLPQRWHEIPPKILERD
jgi:hypothetical protein